MKMGPEDVKRRGDLSCTLNTYCLWQTAWDNQRVAFCIDSCSINGLSTSELASNWILLGKRCS